MILSSILAALAVISFALGVWQWLAGRRFPLHERIPNGDFFPDLSILKPLKGCDAETEECLESWFRQEYRGRWELLFAVASAEDPVCAIVRRLIAKYSDRRAELVVAAPVLGPNEKVSSLCYLARRGRYEYLVVSDADVFIEADFFSNLMTGLREKNTSLVNCFYSFGRSKNAAMRFEAVAANADFWTRVLQAIALKEMDFALGAVMAMRKSDLVKTGGFEALSGYLADDYQLGQRLAQCGELRICTLPVECRSAPYGWRAVWEHQVRWARTIRVCRPVPYFFSILGNGTLWPVLAICFSGPTDPVGRWIFAGLLLLRVLGAVSNSRRLTGRLDWWVALVSPLLDLGQALVWFVSFLGNRITWRGGRFRVDASGKMTRLA